MKVTLKRVSVIRGGAFGVLLINDTPICFTIERTYDPHDEVKIQPGVYRCTRTIFYKGDYETFEVHVPGHTRILFHTGNVEADSDGCIIPGKECGRLNGVPAVLRSRVAFNEFMGWLQGIQSFDLEVSQCA